MDTELQRFKKYINDICNEIIDDIRVVCRNGETKLSSIIVCARSPAFKRMLDSAFKESVSKTIEFPENTLKTIEYIIKYLQHAEINTAEYDIFDLFEILDFTLRYELNELDEIITQNLLERAKQSEYAPIIYALCIDERYQNIKKDAFLTISNYLSSPRIKFNCVNCKHLYNKTLIRCSICKCNTKYHITLKNQKCKNGHVINIDGCQCVNENCKRAAVTASADLLNFTHVSDDTKIEIMEKYIEHINK
ncbi:SKP1/BTB/POZ domain-containing protein [Pacmanvirus A23]|uniref:SKP1/BTB/POZ domain-containing protein n=1 Tax=Pacmanvirus A23 TaxID=1932881 RepID=UPI000A094E45|nr:SKP1/BTB/POZ domain-containing protein [Pacmanvirus A23]SIP85926.1 SKP1/BTB/POZ domain-containing protein [Pacmanvirus A23]